MPEIDAIETASFPFCAWSRQDLLGWMLSGRGLFLGVFPCGATVTGTKAEEAADPVAAAPGPAGPEARPVPGTAGRTGEPLAGYALLQLFPEETQILKLAVDPARRREGLGRELLRTAVALGLERGMSRMSLMCRQDNLAALGLYRSEGFMPVGRMPGYYRRLGGGCPDAYLLTLSLSGTAPRAEARP